MKQLLQFRLRELEFWKGITVRFEETRKKLKNWSVFMSNCASSYWKTGHGYHLQSADNHTDSNSRLERKYTGRGLRRDHEIHRANFAKYQQLGSNTSYVHCYKPISYYTSTVIKVMLQTKCAPTCYYCSGNQICCILIDCVFT